jgi:hypothetical protein
VDPDPDPYLVLKDSDTGGPKTNESYQIWIRNTTLLFSIAVALLNPALAN